MVQDTPSSTPHLSSCSITSPLGTLILIASSAALVALTFAPSEANSHPPEGVPVLPRAHRTSVIEPVDLEAHPVLSSVVEQLDLYFAGRLFEFSVPLDLAGTPFQRRAWHALLSVPYAQTASYGQQAARVGQPTAVRAIGLANGKNPISIIVPCHRVIGSNGALTGYGGGVEKKAWLLAHEKAHAKVHAMVHAMVHATGHETAHLPGLVQRSSFRPGSQVAVADEI